VLLRITGGPLVASKVFSFSSFRMAVPFKSLCRIRLWACRASTCVFFRRILLKFDFEEPVFVGIDSTWMLVLSGGLSVRRLEVVETPKLFVRFVRQPVRVFFERACFFLRK